MENSINSRSIRLFISSTFRDMEEERDILVSKVFPMLRKMADERQVSLTEIDLRWGITEKESQESKVVQICLEEIDRSHPFFIGVLGGRYGWRPIEEGVDWKTIISPKYEDAISDIYEGKSMTELEILHGVFRSKEHIHASFYLRKMPSDKIEAKQQELREKVIQQKAFPVHFFQNTEELSTSVIEDFERMLDELYPIESCNTWQAHVNQQNYYLERLTRYYIPNRKAEEEIAEFTRQEAEKGLIITGQSGIGKSTLMARVALDIYKSNTADVLSFFSSNHTNGSSFNDMADWFCQGFSTLFNFNYDREASHIREFQRAAATIRPKRKLFLFIDGINQIMPTEAADTNLVWWPTWHENVYIVVSTPTNAEIANNLSRFRFRQIEVTKLNLDQRVELSDKYLKGDYNKSLSASQLDIIGRSNPLLDNTLVFVSFLDELRRFGSFENLSSEITRMASYKTTNDFFGHIIERQRSLFHTPKLKLQYDKVLMAILLSYNGLSEDFLIELTGISRLDLSMLLGINELYLSIKDGRIVFSHNAFKEAVVNSIHSTDEETLRRDIIKVYQKRKSDSLNTDSLFEVAYQYYQLREFDRLYVLLSNMTTYSHYSMHGKLNELGRYWGKLIKINPYRYDILNIIFNEMNWEDSAMMSGMKFYMTISLQSNNILNLSRFILNNMEQPEAGKRLNYALIKMLENEQEDEYEKMRETAKHNIAVSYRMERDYSAALRQYKEGIDENTDMSSAVISNIGEIFLAMYEESENKTYADYARKILSDVLEARIKKYKTEEHEMVALAYANYAAAVFYEDVDYSLELAKKSLSIFERLKGHYSIEVARQYGNIAREMLTNNIDECIKNAEAALDIYIKLLGENNDSAMEMHRLLALAYMRKENFDKAWEHTRAASQLILSQDKEGFIYLLKSLFVGFFNKKLYDDAAEVGMYALPLLEKDVTSAISFHDNLGKIYHLKGAENLSDEHYEKSVEISLKNELYESAQSSLIFLFQKHCESGEMNKAEQRLREIIEITDTYNLDESTILAYAYYNLGLVLYGYHEDKDESVKLIERAIKIRQRFVDEDDKVLGEYKSNLNKIIGGQKAGIDSTGANSAQAVNEMKYILGDTNKSALAAFKEGMQAFDKGNISEALHMFNKAQMNLEEDAPASALAQITRYIAYSEEMRYSNKNASQEDLSKVISLYGAAVVIAQKDKNYSLAAKICHDEAMFCSRNGFYAASEKCYWHKLENLLAADEYMSMETAVTLYNISIVMMRQGEPEAHVLLALTAWALYIYNHIEEEDEDLKERLIENLQEFSQDFSDEDIPDVDAWGMHTSLLEQYIEKLENFDIKRLQSSLIKLTSEYCKEIGDIENFVWTRLSYLNTILAMSDYLLAMHEIEGIMKDYMAYLDDETKQSIIETYYIISIAIHDMDKANEIFANHSIPDEARQRYTEQITPCTYAFLNKDRKAEKLYAELQDKAEKGSLYEGEYFDLALFCAYKKMPYEGKKYMALWKKCISQAPLEYQHYYEPAMKMLQNLLEP